MPTPINHHHALLISKRLEILEGLKDRGDIHIPQRSADPLDEALAASARLTAVDRINQQTKLLRRVDRAIHKLLIRFSDDDDYGVCEACGDSIPESRLNVVPWAELCVACQTKTEQENEVYK